MTDNNKPSSQSKLTPDQERILYQQGTEPACSSALNFEKRPGHYDCINCEATLFDANTKYDSGSGWPSFFQPREGAIGTKPDHSLGRERTEVHCANCSGHLGHVFDDGPAPTGLRYCINGAVLKFVPNEE